MAASIRACASAVERTLRRAKITLTMGGEPTYLPHDPSGPEWSIAALGPTKLGFARRFAGALLRQRFPGALVTQFYGKQYPGEPLPRWTVSISHDPKRALWPATERLLLGPPHLTHNKRQAAGLARALAADLGHSRRLLEAREARSASRHPKGWVLPLNHDGRRWVSGTWSFGRRRDVPLVWGDSSIGLRLPLARLPDRALKRALTIEIKDGGLEIFLPPLAPGPYFELIARIHALAQAQDLHGLILSGYFPQDAQGLLRFTFASDPGVLEVNLPPAGTWIEFQDHLAALESASREAGLRTVKFNYNGFEQGTGGGAHLCFGGWTAAESPFLTRRTFLPSVLRHFHNHPVLAYAFTGLFVGPSSQAPRIDETGEDARAELELALRGAERVPDDPYLFTMLFRDLLADRSGNTHRAEISIDKLWNPASPTGTLGLAEFRAVETTPDAHTLALIALLFRAILARLALRPTTTPLTEWGATLHDRFFLPSQLWENLGLVCRDLQRHGIPFRREWLEDFWRWRFPVFGTLQAPRGTITVRHALESWPLLGEQPLGATTVRSIDSSNERVEITLSPALARSGGVLLANGIPLTFPFRSPAGAHTGVRFRAHYRVPSLHPHIPAQSPLRLEWVDRASRTILAAADWHSWRLEGGDYPDRPNDPAEAARRRAERWVPRPQRTGKKAAFRPAPPQGNRLTFDLRHHGVA
jgi:uncharacterized protein (DUF2126 family)